MKQNDIWLVNLDPTIGAEIKKTRPAVIVNDDALGRLPLKVIVPLTDWKDRYRIAPWMVEIESSNQNQLTKHSCGDCFQVRSISKKRFVRKPGTIDSETMDQIKRGLAQILSMEF